MVSFQQFYLSRSSIIIFVGILSELIHICILIALQTTRKLLFQFLLMPCSLCSMHALCSSPYIVLEWCVGPM